MFWRSNSNKNRTAQGDGEPVGGGQQPADQPGVVESSTQDSEERISAKIPPQETKEEASSVPAKEMLKEANRPTREEMLAQMAENEEAMEMFKKIQGLRSSMNSLREQQSEDPVSETMNLKQKKAPQQAPPQRPQQTPQTPKAQKIRAAEQAVINGAKEDAQEKRRLQEKARQRQMQIEKEQRKAMEAQKKAARINKEAEKKRREAAEAERRAKEVARKKALEAMEAERRAKQEAARRKDIAAAAKLSEESAGMATPEEKAAFFGETINHRTAARTKTEKARLKEEEKQRHKEEVRRRRLEKVARKRAEKAQKLEAKERHKQEKRRMLEAKARLEAQSEADAEMGGGIVNVQGVQIKTEINKQPIFSLKDFLGIRSKAEKQAATEEEQAKLEEERKNRQASARAAAYIRSIQRRASYEKSKVGQKIGKIKAYSETHKKGMLMIFSISLMFILGAAGIYNYCTAYEYSYNGQVLGYVKEMDDVLQITDLVQTALTEEKNMKVVIDAKDDIDFDRKWVLDGSKIDDSEQVLKRLTYMGDLKVKVQAIYVNGKRIGAVQTRKTAEKVLKDVAEKYTEEGDNIEIEKVQFLENVEIKTASVNLENLYSEKEMVNLLCTSGEKVIQHKVVKGDTLHSIAKEYDVWEDQLLEDNKGIDSKKLKVGSTIIVKKQAPVLTYQVVEKITYDKTIEHEVEEQKSADIYEGVTETKQKGSDGVTEVTSRVTLQNGEKINEKELESTVKKEAVKEIVLVGTKERPATVGSGKYIWPLKGGYTKTSGFGARWGRQHKGVDLAVSVGTTVYAADGGTVIEAQYSGSYGNVVIIDHQNGQETRYAHNSKLLVKKGDKVYQGQAIAKSGNTGRSTGPHLHFEIRINGVPKNPLNYLP